MSQEEIKAIYESLIESGDFNSMFPTLSGEWEQDKKTFKKLYNSNQDLIEDVDFDIEDEDYLY